MNIDLEFADMAKAGLFLLALACSLSLSIWKGFRARAGRFRWIACAVLMLAGTLGAMVTAGNSTTPDMPPQFALFVWSLLAGMIGAVACGVWEVGSLFRRADR
jgi:hypothetical protein